MKNRQAKKGLAALLAFAMLIGTLQLAGAETTEDELSGVTPGDKVTAAASTEYAEDEGGSSLKLTQSEVLPAGGDKERSISFDLRENGQPRDISAYDGFRFWVKNTSQNALHVRTQFDISARARMTVRTPYYLTDSATGQTTEYRVTTVKQGATDVERWNIPAGFEGYVFIPFASLDCFGKEIDVTKASKMYFWFNSAHLGTAALYIDSLGAADGLPPTFGFETPLVAGGLTKVPAELKATYLDHVSGTGKSLMMNPTVAAKTLELDITVNTEPRKMRMLTGIRFWTKVQKGDNSTGDALYFKTRYQIGTGDNFSYSNNGVTAAAPYYLIDKDGNITAKKQEFIKSLDAYDKVVTLPDGFEGWVYIPFATDALRCNGNKFPTDAAKQVLKAWKYTVYQALDREIYIDNLGFYGGESRPDVPPLVLYSFTSEEVNQKVAQKVVDEINRLGKITSLEQKSAVETARAHYEALSAAERKYVTNLESLEAAEQIVNQLIAKQVTDEIDRLGVITSDKKAAVETARSHYEALTTEQKAVVANLDKLERAEQRLHFLLSSGLMLDFEPGEATVTIGATGTAEPVTDVKNTGEQALYVKTTVESKDTLTQLKLPTRGSAQGLLGIEFWVKNGDTPAVVNIQMDMPNRGRIFPGKYYYLTDTDKQTQQFSISQKKVGAYDQPLITIPANFEGYVNIPFDSMKLFDGNKAVDPVNIGQFIFNIVDNTAFYLDSVRASCVVGQTFYTEQEVQEVLDRALGVEDTIGQLTDITLKKKAEVRAAREAYNALPVEIRLLVSNARQLTDAEATLRELQPSKYILDFEDGALTDWTGLGNGTFETAFTKNEKFEGDAGLHITTTDSGNYMSVTFKNNGKLASAGKAGIEFYLKTGSKPAVFFIQADLPDRALLQSGSPYYLTDLNGNIVNKRISGTNLGGNFGWQPVLTIPANFEGFLNVPFDGFSMYDAKNTKDVSKFKNCYFVFTQATELTVDAVRCYDNMLEGVFFNSNEATAAEIDQEIAALGKVTEEKTGVVAALRQRYDRLPKEYQPLVTKLEVLEQAEQKLADIAKDGAMLGFDGQVVTWSMLGGSAEQNKKIFSHGDASLLMKFPQASNLTLLNTKKDLSSKDGVEFWVSAPKGSVYLNLQADMPSRAYIGKGTEYYLTNLEGETEIKDVATEGIISIPAGFTGFVNIPFESFVAYDRSGLDITQVGCLYFSTDKGYDQYGVLYIDALCGYDGLATGFETMVKPGDGTVSEPETDDAGNDDQDNENDGQPQPGDNAGTGENRTWLVLSGILVLLMLAMLAVLRKRRFTRN